MTQVLSCRAKLEEALERLQRIVGAMEADAVQAAPDAVERAVRGLVTPGHGSGKGEAGQGGGYALSQAGRGGQLGEDCDPAPHRQQPPPCPLPAALDRCSRPHPVHFSNAGLLMHCCC